MKRSLLLCLLVVAPGLACGESGTGDLTDRPVAKLRASPSTVVFGRVPVGMAAQQSIGLTNAGNAAAVLAWGPGSPPGCDEVGPEDSFCVALHPDVIPVGGEGGATVVFLSRAASAPLEVDWTLECGEGCEVPLQGRGNGVEQALEAPAQLDFGRMFPGCGAERELTLRSLVDVELEIRSVRLEADVDDVYGFELSRNPPFQLEPGATVQGSVRFGAREGDFPGMLTFEVVGAGLGLTDGIELTVPIELIGRGDRADPPCD